MSQNIIFTIAAFVISMLSGFVMIPQILNYCKQKNLYDIPNERKVHKNAIPRLGGLCFMPSMLLAFLLAMAVFGRVSGKEQITLNLWSAFFFISLMLIYGVGIIDDIIGLGARTKFMVQIAAAALVSFSGLYINNLYGLFGVTEIPAYLGIPISIFVIVFIDNAINLIDGIDGLAGGLAFLALGGFLICFAREGVWTYCILISGLMGVLIPYLYFNIFGNAEKNRKIFMGDSGSLTLGFILGFLFVKFAMDNPQVMSYRTDGLMLSLTLLLVPMFDVVRVVFVRLYKKQHLFQADKNHIHHRLMQTGLSQHQSLLVILALAFFYVAINILLFQFMQLSITIIIAIDVVIYALFHYLLEWRIQMQNS